MSVPAKVIMCEALGLQWMLVSFSSLVYQDRPKPSLEHLSSVLAVMLIEDKSFFVDTHEPKYWVS